MRDGFNLPTITPEYSMFYGYAHSAMRAVTMVKTLFDVDESEESNSLEYTNNKIVLIGISGGSVTSLIVNGVDDRLDGVIAIAGMGGF